MEIGWNGHLAASKIPWKRGSQGRHFDFCYVCIGCNSRFELLPCECGGKHCHTSMLAVDRVYALICDDCGKATVEWTCPNCANHQMISECPFALWMT